jgi:CBS domain-containing protein
MYKTNRALLVHEIMSFPVISVRESDSVKKAAAKMSRHDIAAVVVVDKDNKPVGMITQGDIVRRVLARTSRSLATKASSIMSKPVVSVVHGARIEDAARLMARKKLKRLCVVDQNKKLVGIVTDNDIMKNASYMIDVLNEIINTGYEGEP